MPCMSDLFNAFEMSPVPTPGPDAVAPEPFRGIYGMPAFVTISTSDLAASTDFWVRGLGFFELYGERTSQHRPSFQASSHPARVSGTERLSPSGQSDAISRFPVRSSSGTKPCATNSATNPGRPPLGHRYRPEVGTAQRGKLRSRDLVRVGRVPQRDHALGVTGQIEVLASRTQCGPVRPSVTVAVDPVLGLLGVEPVHPRFPAIPTDGTPWSGRHSRSIFPCQMGG